MFNFLQQCTTLRLDEFDFSHSNQLDDSEQQKQNWWSFKLFLFWDIFFIWFIFSGQRVIPKVELEVLMLKLKIFISSVETKIKTDLEIIINCETIRVHKLIISDRNGVIKAVLVTNASRENKDAIEIADCRIATFKMFLKFFYSGQNWKTSWHWKRWCRLTSLWTI